MFRKTILAMLSVLFSNAVMGDHGNISFGILTLNLHCYQEENQNAKLSQIAKAINDLDVDIVCLQEAAEPWNDGKGDWNSNAAKIIRERLSRYYHLHTDWSHQGFGRYREGLAILSKHEFIVKDSGYVSGVRDPFSINARKIVTAQVNVPDVGPVNVFSTHLSWMSEGFCEQFENLRKWAGEKHVGNVNATFLCGDFNSKVGSEGYQVVMNSGEYRDMFYVNDGRIDYVFMKKGSPFETTGARVLFTDESYGRVSDHPGYYVELRLKR